MPVNIINTTSGLDGRPTSPLPSIDEYEDYFDLRVSNGATEARSGMVLDPRILAALEYADRFRAGNEDQVGGPDPYCDEFDD